MKAKNKKGAPKSTETRLSDLKPGKDARGGSPRPDGGPTYRLPFRRTTRR